MESIKIETPLKYGFFNSAEGKADRVYSAEDFTNYLSAMICNGILDTWGNCFSISYDSSVLTIDTGYIWIDGHYAILDRPQKVDLSGYADDYLSRWIAIGISCDIASSIRECAVELLPGLAGDGAMKPNFSDTSSKKYLTLAYVQINSSGNVTAVDDVRADADKCGYVKCILGKCGVTELMAQMEALQTRLAEIEGFLGMSGIYLVESGLCGDQVIYRLYSNGLLTLTGIGATYSREPVNSPFYQDKRITRVEVSSGVTTIGAHLFYQCSGLASISLSDTITEIDALAFDGTALPEISLPSSLRTIDSGAFAGINIVDITLPVSVESIGAGAFTRTNLTTIIYKSTVARWESIQKYANWNPPSLTKIICSDGNLIYNESTDTWKLEDADIIAALANLVEVTP